MSEFVLNNYLYREENGVSWIISSAYFIAPTNDNITGILDTPMTVELRLVDYKGDLVSRSAEAIVCINSKSCIDGIPLFFTDGVGSVELQFSESGEYDLWVMGIDYPADCAFKVSI